MYIIKYIYTYIYVICVSINIILYDNAGNKIFTFKKCISRTFYNLFLIYIFSLLHNILLFTLIKFATLLFVYGKLIFKRKPLILFEKKVARRKGNHSSEIIVMLDVVVIEQTLTLSRVPIHHVSRLRENGSTIDLVCYRGHKREKKREQDERFDVSRDASRCFKALLPRRAGVEIGWVGR